MILGGAEIFQQQGGGAWCVILAGNDNGWNRKFCWVTWFLLDFHHSMQQLLKAPPLESQRIWAVPLKQHEKAFENVSCPDGRQGGTVQRWQSVLESAGLRVSDQRGNKWIIKPLRIHGYRGKRREEGGKSCVCCILTGQGQIQSQCDDVHQETLISDFLSNTAEANKKYVHTGSK